MAIYEVNPDYPVPGQPFQLYQCPEVRNNPANQSQLAYWYNGQSLTPTYPPTLSGGNQGYQGMAQPMDSRRYDAPQQPMMQMPQQQQPAQLGFNQLAESRRFAGQQPAQPQIQTIAGTQNPWAVQTTSAPVQTSNPYVASMMPQLSSHLTFDRSTAWGDQPSYNVPIPPQINWGSQPQQPVAQQQPQMVAPVYPVQQSNVPPVQNWEAIAAENWKGVR